VVHLLCSMQVSHLKLYFCRVSVCAPVEFLNSFLFCL
jgi:hypothetical protein